VARRLSVAGRHPEMKAMLLHLAPDCALHVLRAEMDTGSESSLRRDSVMRTFGASLDGESLHRLLEPTRSHTLRQHARRSATEPVPCTSARYHLTIFSRMSPTMRVALLTLVGCAGVGLAQTAAFSCPAGTYQVVRQTRRVDARAPFRVLVSSDLTPTSATDWP
jgi:hypothetical protein